MQKKIIWPIKTSLILKISEQIKNIQGNNFECFFVEFTKSIRY